MTTKLTLAIDETVIKKAKEYALKKKMSLSKLVEFYFSSITSASSKKKQEFASPPITSELSGMVKTKKAFKDKDILLEALIEKHL